MADVAHIEHLLRRTEFVARPDRVRELKSLSLEQAIANVLDVPTDPGSVTFVDGRDWHRGVELTHFWLDRMAHDSPRPIQEKMAFFWHGHFCSDMTKVGDARLMRQQIDLFRTRAIGNLRDLAIRMSTQVAMLRYLDNNQNKASSPNQNFARELMELFLLGVGNYTEADVEASTAAWTGHTDQWDSGAYVWRPDWHDASSKRYLGRTINNGGDARLHGAETIEVVLGNGVVPVGPNRHRPTREVAAEFVSKKLWAEFAGTPIPPAVLARMRNAALDADFDLEPWLTELFRSPEFYAPDVRSGRVRTPVEYIVTCLVALGRPSAAVTPIWLMDGMGQRPLYPPNVSGWKHNGYWVNASAMARRTDAARQFMWRALETYWEGDGRIRLAGGTVSKDAVQHTLGPAELVDRLLALMRITVTPRSRRALVDFAERSSWWERTDLLALILVSPDVHLA